MKNRSAQTITVVAFLALLVLLVDPFMYFMPPALAMLALLAAVVLLGVWAGFIMLEKASDERDLMHRTHADRIAYLSGLAALTAALIAQGFANRIDPWITAALAVMVIAAFAGRIYFDRYH